MSEEKDQQPDSTVETAQKDSAETHQADEQVKDITTTTIAATAGASSDSKEQKIEILFRSTANAPIISKPKWMVKGSSTVSTNIAFLRKFLGLDPSQSIFLYVNQSFAPALDQTIKNLYDCYESDKKLVLYYATTPAWG